MSAARDPATIERDLQAATTSMRYSLAASAEALQRAQALANKVARLQAELAAMHRQGCP